MTKKKKGSQIGTTSQRKQKPDTSQPNDNNFKYQEQTQNTTEVGIRTVTHESL